MNTAVALLAGTTASTGSSLHCNQTGRVVAVGHEAYTHPQPARHGLPPSRVAPARACVRRASTCPRTKEGNCGLARGARVDVDGRVTDARREARRRLGTLPPRTPGPRGPRPGWLAPLSLTPVLAMTCLCLAGCGGAGVAAGPASGARSAKPHEVLATSARGLGAILVDGSGYTLYAYVPDHQGPSKCGRQCAHDRPPLLLPPGAPNPVGGSGVDSALLGTARRTNGARQVTYGGWPLYRYHNDAAPAEVTGQGADMGLWYVLGAGGSLDRRLGRTGSTT